MAALTARVDAWQEAIAALDEDEVMTVGLSQASEIDKTSPFGHLVLHMNRELIAHGAEILVLRNLYAARRCLVDVVRALQRVATVLVDVGLDVVVLDRPPEGV